MNETPDRIDYQGLIQDALRSVVRRCLAQVADYGLPGAHHFYISFATTAADAALPQNLRDKYPENITVVIQNDYQDLEVEAEGFGVTLRFGGVPQRLYVPWTALVSFYDPSEQFALRFEPRDSPSRAESEPFPILDPDDNHANPRPPVRGLLAAADRLAAEKAKLAAKEQERLRAEAESAESSARTATDGESEPRAADAGAADAGAADAGAADAGAADAGADGVGSGKKSPGKRKSSKKRPTRKKATDDATDDDAGPRADEDPVDGSGDTEAKQGGGVVVSFEDFKRR